MLDLEWGKLRSIFSSYSLVVAAPEIGDVIVANTGEDATASI